MTTEEEVRLTLRLPAAIRDRLIDKAKENGRSLNAEMISRLERTILEEDEYVNIYEFTGELEKRIEWLEQEVSKMGEFLQPGRYDRD